MVQTAVARPTVDSGLVRITFDVPESLSVGELNHLLTSIVDLIVVCRPPQVSDARLNATAYLQESRDQAHEEISVHQLSYNSPLEIVLGISSGATALMLVASHLAAVRSNWARARTDAAKSHVEVARAETEIMQERLRRQAVLLVEEQLGRITSGREAVDPSLTTSLRDNAADALGRINKIEKVR